MRSCLLWLSLLLVVLADRNLASPYFDEGKFRSSIFLLSVSRVSTSRCRVLPATRPSATTKLRRITGERSSLTTWSAHQDAPPTTALFAFLRVAAAVVRHVRGLFHSRLGNRTRDDLVRRDASPVRCGHRLGEWKEPHPGVLRAALYTR